MEVKDVYDATVHIENALKKWVVVTKSELQSQVIEEKPITLLTKMRFYSENLILTIRCK